MKTTTATRNTPATSPRATAGPVPPARRTSLLLLAATLLALAPTAGAQENRQTFHGEIQGSVTWSGTVLLDGDVTVPEDAELTLARGTRVLVQEGDAARTGWNDNWVEIHVFGSLRITGTEAEPVRFTSLKGGKMPLTGEGYLPRWHGIVLRQSSTPKVRVLEYAWIQSALSAVQIPVGLAEVRHCLFEGCGTGVEVGSAFASLHRLGTPGGMARPIVESCRFRVCHTGVYAQDRGGPLISRCVFQGCHYAVANHRHGTTFSLEPPGIQVDRSDFFANATGVYGSALVTNCIFDGNQLALRPSRFHHELSVRIDFLTYRANLFHENRKNLEGEAAIGRALEGDPRWVDAQCIEREWPPVPPGLALEERSPARGAATDGGDLGALGEVGRPDPRVLWKPAGTLLRDMQMLGGNPPSPGGGADALPRRPELGEPSGDSWWVAGLTDADGILSLRDTYRAWRGSGWIAFRLEAEAAGTATFELNGDLQHCRGYRDDEPIFTLEVPRHFDARALVFEAELQKGIQQFLFWVDPASGRASLALSYAADVPLELRPVPEGRQRASRIRSARRAREAPDWLEVRVSQTLHWDVNHHPPRARLLDEGGSVAVPERRLQVELVGPRELKIGPVPDGLDGRYQLVLEGLVDPAGREQDGPTPAFPVKL